MTYTKRQAIRSDYISGEYVTTASLIKAGILVETEATKMLTAQMNDTNLTKAEQVTRRIQIKRAGYRIEITGNMKTPRVYEEHL